ncbi:MAG: dolichol kinase [Halobacteriaceae archaeon]
MGELARRLVHASGVGYPLLYLLDREFGVGLVGWPELQALLVASSAVALGLEALRLAGYVDWAVFDKLTRGYEADNIAGYALYLFGMTAAALFFPPWAGIPAMLMLAIGDPISGLLSADNIAKQAWVLLVMFGVCLLLAAPFVSPGAAVAGAAGATVADGYKPVVRTHVIDDNLTIPLLAGAAMWATTVHAPL